MNVHPTKAEVRFLDQSLVHEVLRRALADALGGGAAPALHFQLQSPQVPPGGETVGVPGLLPGVLDRLAGFRPAEAPWPPAGPAWGPT